MRKLTYEEVKRFIEDNSECKLISTEHVNSKSKIKLKCSCGSVFETFFGDFRSKNKRQCNTCSENISSIKRSNTHEKFTHQVYELVGDEYSILGSYKKIHSKILMKHNVCGYEWNVTPNNFIVKSSRCPKCSGRIKDKTTDYFKKEVYNLTGEEYLVLSEYTGNKSPIYMIHQKCNKVFKSNPNRFLNGIRCPYCGGTYSPTNKEFIDKIYLTVKNEYTVLGKYENSKTKIAFRHNKCGHVFNMTPNSFLSQNQRCPKCNESHGEQVITKYLRKNHIKFRSQYKIKGCKNIKPLSFDFALFNKDKLMALVEFDGIQHTEIVTHFGGEEGFKKRQHNDAIKNNYCLVHEIPLIRISYKVKNIEEYLENELKKLNTKIQLSIL